MQGLERELLGGAWDLVTTFNWSYNLFYNLPNRPHVGCPSCKYGYKPKYNYAATKSQ